MRTILVVDDSLTTRTLVTKALATTGHRIMTASDGEEAMQKTMAVHPDLIVLDVIMPHKNGYQVCRQLKSDATTRTIKIVLLTCQDRPADRFWGIRQGADAYLTKPFREAELLATIARLL